jgi:hypothetical protein
MSHDGASGCRDGARWPLSPTSSPSCTPTAIPRSRTRPRSPRSPTASCGGAASAAGTSGRRQLEPGPLARVALNAIVSVSGVPGRSLPNDPCRRSIPACSPNGIRPQTVILTRRRSAPARSGSSGGAALRVDINGRRPRITAPTAVPAARCAGSNAAREPKARSSQRDPSRSSTPTSPPNCTQIGTPGSTRLGSRRGRASSCGGSVRAAGMSGR